MENLETIRRINSRMLVNYNFIKDAINGGFGNIKRGIWLDCRGLRESRSNYLSSEKEWHFGGFGIGFQIVHFGDVLTGSIKAPRGGLGISHVTQWIDGEDRRVYKMDKFSFHQL